MTTLKNNDRAAIVKAIQDGSFHNPELETVLLEMNGAKKMTTVAFLIEALRAGGYDFKANDFTSAKYAGVTEFGDVIYTVTYHDVDDDGGVGSVYVRYTDGAWKADF